MLLLQILPIKAGSVDLTIIKKIITVLNYLLMQMLLALVRVSFVKQGLRKVGQAV